MRSQTIFHLLMISIRYDDNTFIGHSDMVGSFWCFRLPVLKKWLISLQCSSILEFFEISHESPSTFEWFRIFEWLVIFYYFYFFVFALFKLVPTFDRTMFWQTFDARLPSVALEQLALLSFFCHDIFNSNSFFCFVANAFSFSFDDKKISIFFSTVVVAIFAIYDKKNTQRMMSSWSDLVTELPFREPTKRFVISQREIMAFSFH